MTSTSTISNKAQSYITVATKEEKRFDRASLRTVALALVLVCAAIGITAYRLTFPTDGWSATTDYADMNPIFSQNLLGLPSALQVGDKLLAVEGHPFVELASKSLQAKPVPLASYAAGKSIRYTVLRAGKTVEVTVTLANWTEEGLASAIWQIARGTPRVNSNLQYGGLPFWVIILLAIFIFSQRPRYRPAQLIFLGAMIYVAVTISNVVSPFSLADALQAATAWAGRIGYFGSTLCVVPLQLHFILVFPGPKTVVQRFPGIIPLIYVVPWLVFGYTNIVPGSDFLFFILLALYEFLLILILLHTVMTEKDPVQQAQMRWFVLGVGLWSLRVVIISLSLLQIVPRTVMDTLERAPRDLFLVICVAMAILYDQLFDINVILSRALVYGGLTAGVIGIYALVVGGIGRLVQAQDNVLLSLFATGLIAVAFHPLRLRLQTMVNHLLYGARDEPYQVLSKLSEKMEGALEPATLLPTMTETIVETLKLSYAAIVLGQHDEAQIVAAHGAARGNRLALPLVYQGETVGELWLDPGPGEAFQPAELNLLKTIAQQASVAVYTVKQNLDLQQSRTRLVTAREEERRRIRRDLHDGLGPTLANFVMRLEQARESLPPGADQSATLLDTLAAQAQTTISDIRRLVYELRPPDLDEYGLVSTLREYLHRMQPRRTTITLAVPDDLPDLPAAVEVAAYRIVQEAVNNAIKHAGADLITVVLMLPQATDTRLFLHVEICDNGVGLPVDHPIGIGLRSMRERAEELGGSCVFGKRAEGGTQVVAQLPIG